MLIAAILLICAPALAADECAYLSKAGDRIAFLDDGQKSVILTRKGQSGIACSWAITPDGPHPADIVCEDGTSDGYFFASSDYKADNQDLLIFLDDVWYRRCFEPA